jgi:DNA-binding GntR family transcriptional regulator
MGQLENKPLRERIADLLRESILAAELKPGDPIVESTLAASLGVSRAPLREALQILNTEGLVEVVPYHKTTVRRLLRKDIEELYSLRSVLETFAITRMIQQQNDEAAAQLRQICQQMIAAANQQQIERVSSLDHQFHDAVIRASQHDLLVTTWSNVSQRVRQVLALRDMQRGDVHQMVRSHMPIVEAIEAHDTELAVQLMDAHIATASEFIVEFWDDHQIEPG